MKKIIWQMLRDCKNYLEFYKYKNTLPKNPVHDDIYLVEYPKSGITWLSFLIGNIELKLNKQSEIITLLNYTKYVPDIHQIKCGEISRILKRTFIKSHDVYNPYYNYVIYIVRHPYDVMVSYYNFMRERRFNKGFEDFVKNKKFGIGSWVNHLNSWYYNNQGSQRIHFIKYENLMKNPKKTLKDLYTNLGIDLNYEIIKSSIDLSNMENMKKSEEFYRANNLNYKFNFVGKENKILKEQLLTDEIKKYIDKKVENIIDVFYQ